VSHVHERCGGVLMKDPLILEEELAAADRVNGRLIRICCDLYAVARIAGADPELPEMKDAEEQLKNQGYWDETRWEEPLAEQELVDADLDKGTSLQ
jgi:hypothetical protein